MKKSNAVGDIPIVVQLGMSSLASRQDNDVQALSKNISKSAKELVADLAIPASVQITVQEPNPDSSPSVSINGEPCRLRRQFVNGNLGAKELAIEVAYVLLQNREKLIDAGLAGSIADSVRDEQKSPRDRIYLAGLSRAGFHDYLRLLVRRCFRIDGGDRLSDSGVDTLKQWSSQDCFEEAVRSPKNLQLVLYRTAEWTDETADENGKLIRDELEAMRDLLFGDLGIRLPQIQLREDWLLDQDEIRLQINDLRLPPLQTLDVYDLLVNETVDRLAMLNIKGRRTVDPTNGAESAIVHGSDGVAEACRQASCVIRGRNEYTALIAGEHLRKFAGSFIVLGTVEYELQQIKTMTPNLVEMVEARFDLYSIVRFFRYLADEEISLQNLRRILEALLLTTTTSALDFSKLIVLNPYAILVTPVIQTRENESDNVRTYGEALRNNLKREISYKYTKGQNTLIVYLLDPKIESLMKESNERALTESERKAVISALEKKLGGLPVSAQDPIILTLIEVRRAFRDLITIEFPNVAVLSHQQLSEDLNVQPIATISLD
jgi:type III secretory pathway component EscV